MVRAHCFFGFFLLNFTLGAQSIISTVAGGTPPLTPGTATRLSIGDPPRVAVDQAGNVYFGSLHSVFRVDSSGNLTRVAGNGRAGYTGDGGLATSAQFKYPSGIAVDNLGNLYVADRDASVVRRISAAGIIATVAGTGVAGYSGDGGVATAAQLNQPAGLAVDGNGNLYVADAGNNCIRQVAGGNIATVAGTGNPGYTGDGGLATSAGLNGPEGVAVDASGNLYIADTIDDRVRKVAPDGTITTIAGTGFSAVYGSIYDETGVSTTTGDNGPAASAAVVLPTDVAVDRSGNLYIADYGNGRIRVVSKSIINTIAGRLDGIPPTIGQAALSVSFSGPTGVAADNSGNVYFAEGSIGTGSGLAGGDYRIWKVTPTGVLQAAAGTGVESYSGDGGASAFAQLNQPASVAVDAFGTLYFADSRNHRIRRIRTNGAIDTVAGNGSAGFSGDGASAVAAQLNQPMGVAVDSSGNLVIADTGNNRIRRVSSNGTITTIAGNGNASFFGDGGPAVRASVHAPQGVALDRSGDVLIADTLNQRIRRITPDGIIQVVAGNGGTGVAADGAQAANAPLNQPSAVVVDGAGNILFTEQGNGRVRAVSPAGNIVTLARGLGGPRGLALDNAGNLYVTDAGRNGIVEITPDGTVTAIAGLAITAVISPVPLAPTTVNAPAAPVSCCYGGDGGPAANAALNAPWGIGVDASGNIYFADSGNDAIRAITPAPTAPAISAIANGASNQSGPIAPGLVVVIFGSGLGPGQLAQAPGAPSTQLAGVSVLFNGVAGQMLYAQSKQVSAIVPAGISGSPVEVVVENRNLSAATSIALTAVAPALFTADTSGAGQALALNSDGSANGPAHSAARGSAITLFATGTASLPVAVTIGGTPATVVSTGSPGPGVVSVTALIPPGVPSGQLPVAVQCGGAVSQASVTVAVGGN
jgi:uncharacterized protein (TIGR03437 family)